MSSVNGVGHFGYVGFDDGLAVTLQDGIYRRGSFGCREIRQMVRNTVNDKK